MLVLSMWLSAISIFPINAELRGAWRLGLESSLTTNASEATLYKILPDAEQAMEDVVALRPSLSNSNGRS